MPKLTRRDLIVRGLITSGIAPLIFIGSPARADRGGWGSSFMLGYAISERSKVVFEFDFQADRRDREMSAQLQQQSVLSKQTFWRTVNMIVKSAGSVKGRRGFRYDANEYRVAVGMTEGYTYTIKVLAQRLDKENRPEGELVEITSQSGST